MIAAVDIGGTKIAVGIVDDAGKVLSRTQSLVKTDLAYSLLLDLIANMLRTAARDAGAEITGIGIGSTGIVLPLTGEFGDVQFFPQWQGKRPVEDLARIFKVSAAIENDGDAGALAEAAWGAGKGKTRLVYVTFGTGIGGGMILDGELYRGVDGAHPECGHHVVDLSGPECCCGFRGCWETVAAGPAITAWMETQAPADYPHRNDLSARRICELARQGDRLAIEAVKRHAYYLGLGLANLINLFTPDVIVLAGSVMKSADLFLDGAREVIRQGCRFVPAEKTELALASLGDDANLIGAARVWHYRCGPGARSH